MFGSSGVPSRVRVGRPVRSSVLGPRCSVFVEEPMNRIDLTNRRAVVTGGAQGIGRATVERFLDSGAIVSLWDMDAKELETAAAELKSRGKIHTAVVDVSNNAQVEAAAAATIAAIGGIDILVANAGIAGPN